MERRNSPFDRKRVLLLSIFCILTSCLNAWNLCINGIYYQTVANQAIVTSRGFDEATGENLSAYTGYITIPSTISHDGRTYTVTSIYESAFASSPDLLGVSLPSSIRYIGGAAFLDCPQLQDFTIPESVMNVGESAFACCTGLRTMEIAEGTTWLREMTLYMCNHLQTLILPTSIDSIGERCLEHCTSLSEVYSLSRQVPRADSTMLRGIQPETITLYVPSSAVDAYSSHPVWGRFGQIIALFEERNGLTGVAASSGVVQKQYNPDGTPFNGHQGVRILQYRDGSTRKVLTPHSINH